MTSEWQLSDTMVTFYSDAAELVGVPRPRLRRSYYRQIRARLARARLLFDVARERYDLTEQSVLLMVAVEHLCAACQLREAARLQRRLAHPEVP